MDLCVGPVPLRESFSRDKSLSAPRRLRGLGQGRAAKREGEPYPSECPTCQPRSVSSCLSTHLESGDLGSNYFSPLCDLGPPP